MASPRPLCVVVGAGTKYASNESFYGDTSSEGLASDVKWGLGGALPIVFAERGYDTVVMSRSLDNLRPIQAHIHGSDSGARCEAVECDCADEASIAAAFASVRALFPDRCVECLIYNAGYAQPAGASGNPMGGQMVHEVPVENFTMAYSVHVNGLLLCAQQVLPTMMEQPPGACSILVTGNTMSLRGGEKFGVNAPSKFAQRGLTQVMSQEYKPLGIHVAHVVVDGALDAPGMRTMMGERFQEEEEAPGSLVLSPAEVAKAFLYLAEQHPSVWTHEIALTPYAVKLGQRL
jgi:NAD(P)-dependent dehydrogenase (short-subunit alcohol dehydrogenase family)|eukprot:COSAG06_NODE_5210_length_3637_cov_2.184285_1_plen_290_part_00